MASEYINSILNKDFLQQTFNELAANRPRNSNAPQFSYGTSGFRMESSKLDIPLFATSLITVLRSFYCSEFIGIMITASHNPPQDNGFKTIEPHGEMLPHDWEPHVTAIANAVYEGEYLNFEKLFLLIADDLLKGVALEKSDLKIILGRDTRDSSIKFSTFLNNFFNKLTFLNKKRVNIIDYSIVTTPQLHFIVRKHTLNAENTKMDLPKEYFDAFFKPFITLLAQVNIQSFKKLVIDCANGVGALQLEQLLPLYEENSPSLKLELINTNYQDCSRLNVECGADFVKTNQHLPSGISHESTIKSDVLFCSLDGDADRIIFYCLSKDKEFCLLDGDRMATLIGEFFIEKLPKELLSLIKLGIVQTAYANGNSTSFITNDLNLDVKCAKTGVKNLHHDAVENFDVGIYFEANGHGTVVFNDKFINALSSYNLKQFELFISLVNQAVGDAITDLFIVVAILLLLQLDPKDWFKKYDDLPNKLIKCVVPNRAAFETYDFERKLSKPVGLQEKINYIVAETDNSDGKNRCFVRASGTEDVVRIYCEASTDTRVQTILAKVLDAIRKATDI
ncbi:hypothetical protein QEN19_000276 [Hanseniaspora menglaensis]